MSDLSLAEKLKPKTLDEFVGQKHLVGPDGVLLPIIKKKKLFSFILWGPPGSGKTSLAYLVKNIVTAEFFTISAVDASVKEFKNIISRAEKLKKLGTPTIVFIDEIHRLNKGQQAFLLPYVEKGVFYLIGATTENPSFEVISPLLSRVKVFILEPLSKEEVLTLLKRAVEKIISEEFPELKLEQTVLERIAEDSQGDARSALNTLEWLVNWAEAKGVKKVSLNELAEFLVCNPLYYDKAGEEHYNLISAFHKSMRGSDPDATIYWMVRMLEAGEDPLYIARRIITCAAEDVGLADPMALVIAVSAERAYETLGSPEGEIALAEAALYVACAPKSNSAYSALKKAREVVKKFKSLKVPLHLRNPVTKLMENLGYGKDYKYAHDYEKGFVAQDFLPEEIKKVKLYKPTERGIEKKIKERLKTLWKGIKSY